MIRKMIRKMINKFGYDVNKINLPKQNNLPYDIDKGFVEVFNKKNSIFSSKKSSKYNDKQYTTYKVTEYLINNKISGDIVECGVFEGLQVVIMALTCMKMNDFSRNIYLYDTFAGMTEPSKFDIKKHRGLDYEANKKKQLKYQQGEINLRCFSPLEKVKDVVYKTGYPKDKIHFIKGDILKTLPNNNHDTIGFLRLDTDFYESTKHELDHLYSYVKEKGVVVQDDYGSWAGAKKAVDEFFASKNYKPLLFRTCKSERAIIKINN